MIKMIIMTIVLKIRREKSEECLCLPMGSSIPGKTALHGGLLKGASPRIPSRVGTDMEHDGSRITLRIFPEATIKLTLTEIRVVKKI